MELKIKKIEQGMKVKCLNCGETIKLTEETFFIDCVAEYIGCKKCNTYCDVQAYMFHGEVVE